MARASKGSQMWLQRAVAEHWKELHGPLCDKLGGTTRIDWLSPIESDDFAEHRDAAFLEQLELGHLVPALAEFWPSNGPQWDGLAISAGGHRILVEAKAHIGEFCSNPSGAKSEKSIARIDAALKSTAAALGAKTPHASGWSLHFYQYANRLAHLHWLRGHDIDAKLLLVGFVNDDEMPGKTTREAWEAAYLAADYVLGLNATHPLAQHVIHAYPDVLRYKL